MSARDDAARAAAALAHLDPSSDRETWVRTAMAVKAAGLDFGAFHAWSAQAGNYKSKADCLSVWRSIKADGGVQAGTLFAMARAAGWTDEGRVFDKRPVDHKTHDRRRENAPQAADARKEGQRAAFDAQAAWQTGEPATDAHPYICTKQGTATGLRVYRGTCRIAGECLDGALMVPTFDMAGTLQTLQFILPSGKKLNAPGRPVTGAFVVGRIVPPGAGQTIAIAEGIGTAWASHQAAGMASVVAFGAGRMEQVAKDFRARYPSARLVLVADAGKERHCADIAKRLSCAWVEMPEGSPSNFDANDLMLSYGPESLSRLLNNPKTQPSRYRLVSAADVAMRPPAPELVRGVLPAKGIGALFGPSGSGKTFLAHHLLAHLSGGMAWWFGHRIVRPVPVVYVGLEGEGGISRRVRAWQTKHGRLPENFHFVTEQPFRLLHQQDVTDLADVVRRVAGAGAVVCIDTLNAAAPGADENSSTDMGMMIASAKRLQSATDGLVLLIHHTGKDATRGLRGHSSLFAALDCAVEVTRDGDRREWRIAKAKDGDDEATHPFKLEVVEIGQHEDGEAITSCVAATDETPAEQIRRAKPPTGANARLTLSAVSEALKSAREFGKGGAPIARPCITLEQAIDAAASKLPCASKRQKERVSSAITSLVSRGNLGHGDGWIWLP